MVFEHGEYTLYTKEVILKGGRKQDIYYFSKGTPKSGEKCDKPDNKEVGINKRTGLPFLRNKK